MSMVNVTNKPELYREAVAEGQINLQSATIQRIQEGNVEKGDPINAAKIAAVMGVKQTPFVIPLCHPLTITGVSTSCEFIGNTTIKVQTTVKSQAKTGVEMEALVAVTTALLTIWDMTKQYEKDERGQYPTTSIEKIQVIKKLKKPV